MIRTIRRAAFLAVLLVAAGLSGEAATPPPIEASASRLLHQAVVALDAQPSYSFDADIAYDDVQPSGIKYVVRASAQFQVQRPGQFFVSYSGDRRKASFYSDGKTFAFFDQRANVYGTAPATTDMDTTLNKIFAAYDFTVPLADFVSNHPGAAFSQGVQGGYDLGPSTVAGTATHHLLFTGRGIDWQLWIDAGATPVVRAFAITYERLPGKPEYFATLSNWKFAPVDAAVFTFTPPKGAIPVKFSAMPLGSR